MYQIQKLYEACKAGDAYSVVELVSSDVDVNEYYGRKSPLYKAVGTDQAVMKEILEKEWWTPLYTAAFSGHAAVVEIVLAAGADVNKGRKTPLYAAARNGHAAVVEILLKARADVNKRTPLYEAARNGHAAVVEILLKAGADVNKGVDWGWLETPLYVAAGNGLAAVVEILLKAGADVDRGMMFRSNNSTPLHVAAEKGFHDVIAVLLLYNADGTIKNKNDKTAVQIMVEKYQEGINEMFKKRAKITVIEENKQLQKSSPVLELKLLIAEKRAFIAEERAVTAEKRVTIAEEQTNIAKECASVETRVARDAEERAIAAELRAIAAEGKAIKPEQRGPLAEKECFFLKQRLSDDSERNAKSLEKRTSIAEERATVAIKNANAVGKKLIIAEERAITAEKRASIAEERIKIAEMEIIAAEKKAIGANNNDNKLLAMEKRAKQAEDTVKTLRERLYASDDKIAELRQMNTTLERTVTATDFEVSRLRMQCRELLQKHSKAEVPSWVIKKEDILLTDKEIGRGAYGVVKQAGFCGLDVVAKHLHKEIMSPYYMQQFKREMDICAQIRHPNIVLFIGATVDQDYIILTELMEKSLRAVLEDKERKGLTFTRQKVSSIATDVGKALNYLHLWKPDAIIHRDVSSSNVLLKSLGADMWKAKLSDFGASNFARQVSTAAPGAAVYAAPESADPEKQSPKMDVFSYGVLLLELSCTKFPTNRQQLIQELSWSALKALIEDCTARELQHRPIMADVLNRLCRIVQLYGENNGNK